MAKFCNFSLAMNQQRNFTLEPYTQGCTLMYWACVCAVSQSCPALCNPMDYSRPRSSVHGIFQARTMQWAAISFSRGSSWPRNQTCVSCIVRWILYHWASLEAKFHVPFFFICKPKVLRGQSRFGLTFIELLEGILHEFWTDECCQQAI